MKSYKKWFYLIATCCIITLVLIYNYSNIDKLFSYGTNKLEDENINKEYKECKNRLDSLEPNEPINIDSCPIYNLSLPSNIQPASEVIEKGKDIPLQFAYNDMNWKRPAYKTYWHTTPTGGRWSYVPTRVRYALHRIFTTVPTASIYYDFAHNLGIVEESKDFDFDHTNINQIVMVAMNSNVKKVVMLDNQVIVIVEPRRKGLQALIIPKNIIQPSNIDEAIVFQMVTPDGYEIDYSLFK
jgi:hypothetical protein